MKLWVNQQYVQLGISDRVELKMTEAELNSFARLFVWVAERMAGLSEYSVSVPIDLHKGEKLCLPDLSDASEN